MSKVSGSERGRGGRKRQHSGSVARPKPTGFSIRCRRCCCHYLWSPTKYTIVATATSRHEEYDIYKDCVCVCVYRERARERERATARERESERARARERERERERERGREAERENHFYYVGGQKGATDFPHPASLHFNDLHHQPLREGGRVRRRGGAGGKNLFM